MADESSSAKALILHARAARRKLSPRFAFPARVSGERGDLLSPRNEIARGESTPVSYTKHDATWGAEADTLVFSLTRVRYRPIQSSPRYGRYSQSGRAIVGRTAGGFLDGAAAREIARRAAAKRRECPRRVRATGRVGRRVEHR